MVTLKVVRRGRVVGWAGLGVLMSSAYAQDRVRIDVEGGDAFQTQNSCAIPADSSRFSYRDLLGRGPFSFIRLTAQINDDQKSGYRILVAPLSFSGYGKFSATVKFNGDSFAPGVDTYGKYVFNTYRLSWWRKWRPWSGIAVRGGLTLLVRDADVALGQGSNHSSFYNLGAAPLFYFFAEKQLNNRFGAEFEFDGLQAPEGSAYDAGLALSYKLSDGWRIKAHARYLNGGTGSGSAYSFATVNFVSVGMEYRL